MVLDAVYKTGQKVPITGLYRCRQCEAAHRSYIIYLTADKKFPPCSVCMGSGRLGETTYRLEHV